MRRTTPALGLVLLLVGCGPLITIPGGSLSGTAAPVPTDWSFSDEVETVQLETRPSDPYSVNVWGVGLGDRFYIAAGDPENRWARNIEADPEVRLRIGETIYEMRAEVTRDPADREAFLAAARTKYDWEPEADETDDAILFRLGPR